MKRIEPKPGQESVWDYPRPPRVEDVSKHVRVVFNGTVIADTNHAKRVLETSHPPVYYIPPEDIKMDFLHRTQQTTYCEFKGRAGYYTVRVGNKEILEAAWFYPNPVQGYETLKDHVAFYPSRMEACYLGDEQVKAQEGDFYCGWITSDIVGPFKGGAGTWGW
ncbi:MAG: DUF427 domain-containing protein [Cyclobacteriaceae bacterium]